MPAPKVAQTQLTSEKSCEGLLSTPNRKASTKFFKTS